MERPIQSHLVGADNERESWPGSPMDRLFISCLQQRLDRLDQGMMSLRPATRSMTLKRSRCTADYSSANNWKVLSQSTKGMVGADGFEPPTYSV